MDSENIIEKRKEKLVRWLKNPYNLTLVAVIALAVIIRLYYFFLTKGQPLWWDEAEYMVLGRHWAGLSPHMTYPFDPVRQVLNPFMLSFFFRLFGVNEFLPRALVLLLSIASVVGMYYLGKEVFNRKIGLLSSFFMSIFWLNLFFTYRILVDIYSLAFFIFSALFFYRYFKKGKPKDIYIAAVLIALGTLFKLSTAFLLPAILIYLLITQRLSFLKKKEIWIAALIFLLIFSPYVIWGFFQFDGFVLSKAAAVTAPKKVVEGMLVTDRSGYFASGIRVMKDYLKLFPSYLSMPFLIIFILGLASMYKLFLGFDVLIKKGNKKLNGLLFVLLILIVPLFFVSFMISHNENRYLLNIFPAIFMISSIFVINLYNFIKKNNKILAIVFMVILIGFAANYQIKYSDGLIKNKLPSYGEVRDAAFWIKENSEPTDVIVTVSHPHIRYYSERNVFITNYEEELDEMKRTNPNLKYFMISIFEHYEEWGYTYAERNNLTLVQAYTAPGPNGQPQPLILIYEF